MSSKKCLTIAGVLAVTGIAAGNWGCGSNASPPPSSVSVSVSQTTATINAGTTKQFTAIVENDPANKGLSWSMSCNAETCGTVSPTSTNSGAATSYTAPASAAESLRVSLTATSLSDPTKTGTVTITVLSSIAASRNSAPVKAGSTRSFAARLS